MFLERGWLDQKRIRPDQLACFAVRVFKRDVAIVAIAVALTSSTAGKLPRLDQIAQTGRIGEVSGCSSLRVCGFST